MVGKITSFAGNVNFVFFLAGYHAQGHDLKIFQKLPKNHFHPKATLMKEWMKPLYIGYSRRWTCPKIFLRFLERAILKFPEV